ncbi:MAG: DUF4388 domain-containing protein [Kofleriaceae bacterium]|nr:DUF4388 domain-containing protein [Kofleriaceae bacterium]
MSLRGAIATMPVDDVLEWAARRAVTGRLVVERDDVARTFWLARGVAVWETSNVPEEQLGQILLRSGLVDERTLADALNERSAGSASFGKILVMVGAVGETDLATILTTKIREALCEVVSWRDGWFDLDPAEPPAGGRVAVGVALATCVDLARGRRDRWIAIRRLIAADGLGFAIRDPAAAMIGATGRVDGRRLMEVIEGGGSAGDAIAALAGERFTVLDVLADLIEMGALEVDPGRGHGDLDRADPVQLARAVEVRLADGDRAGALALAAQALAIAPTDPAIRRLYREAERARVAEVARGLLARQHVPILRRSPEELDAADLSDIERRLAHRVDGRWDLLSLVRTSPFGEVQTLLAIAALADRGIIALS